MCVWLCVNKWEILKVKNCYFILWILTYIEKKKTNKQRLGYFISRIISFMDKYHGATYLRDDEFPSKKADSGQCTVYEQWKRRPWIHNRVYIGKPFQPVQSTSISVPNGTVFAKENLDRSKSPSKNLVKTIRKVNRSRSLKCGPLRYAVYWSPPVTMHLEPRQDIFCDWAVDPANLV